jgi:hypothetical protein
MATITRIANQTLQVPADAVQTAIIDVSGQEAITLQATAWNRKVGGGACAVRVSVLSPGEGNIALDSVWMNVGDAQGSSEIRNLRFQKLPATVRFQMEVMHGRAEISLVEFTGAEEAGFTLELDDLATDFFPASAAGRAPFADNLINDAKLAAGAVTTAKLAAGAATLAKQAFTGLKVLSAAGRNGAGAITLTGAVIGERLIAVFGNPTAGGALLVEIVGTDFEVAVTVTDQIQQAVGDDLSANTYVFLLVPAAA